MSDFKPEEFFIAADYSSEINRLEKILQKEIVFFPKTKERNLKALKYYQEHSEEFTNEIHNILCRTRDFMGNSIEANLERVSEDPNYSQLSISGRNIIDARVLEEPKTKGKKHDFEYQIPLITGRDDFTLITYPVEAFPLAIGQPISIDYEFKAHMTLPHGEITKNPTKVYGEYKAEFKKGKVVRTRDVFKEGKYLVQDGKLRMPASLKKRYNPLSQTFLDLFSDDSRERKGFDLQVVLFDKQGGSELYRGPADVLGQFFPYFIRPDKEGYRRTRRTPVMSGKA